MQIQSNGLAIEVEDTGPGAHPERLPVLLIMGLGMQLVAWPPALLEALQAQGHRVVRFDNRDVGLSARMDHLGVPNLMWESMKLQLGMPVRAPYQVEDLARDALGVLDALRIPRAHVVGVSMGGMIAQRVALLAPERLATLTSVMSSSGARYLPGPKPAVLRALLGKPRAPTQEAILDHYVALFRAIGSPGYPTDEAELRERIVASTRRGYHPAGTVRQLAAVAADTRRADELAKIAAPTLVVHGLADPLVPFACGQDTARRIPGARLVAVPGMGHDLPPGVVDQLLAHLLPHVRQG